MKNQKVSKILKIILLIVLIVALLFLANSFRKFLIIKELQNNFSNYSASTNYHIKSTSLEEDGTIVTMDYYKKDGKQVVISEKNSDDEIVKLLMYDNGDTVNVYYDTPEGKKVSLDSDSMVHASIYNYLESESDWQTFFASMFTKIESTTYRDNECYIVTGFMSSMYLDSSVKQEIYIEKDTGLFVKSIMEDTVTQREYEFGNVEDVVFTEPAIEEYEIIEE